MPDRYEVDLGDGKIHTRFSELKSCTPNGVRRVIAERKSGLPNPWMWGYKEVGRIRHAEFEEEMKRTGKLPQCFTNVLGEDLRVDGIEKEFQAEIFDGVILHSTVDAYRKNEFVGDFKTATGIYDEDIGIWTMKSPRNTTQQTTVYAIQLDCHGISVPRSLYMYEYWSADRSEIIGHRIQDEKITDAMLEKTWDWLEERVQNLKRAMRDAELI